MKGELFSCHRKRENVSLWQSHKMFIGNPY